jgi:CxxC motif-containing protein (DUF1111 family)
MTNKWILSALLLSSASILALPAAAQTPATEAPAAFATPTLAKDAGSQSVSNGIAEPPGDTYQLDQQVYETVHDVSTGLGPVFNGRACAECHQNPVSGAASQFTEVRVGSFNAQGTFVNPTVTINDGANTITGRSIINDRSITPAAQEHVPVGETVHATRAVLSSLGDGFVEAIPDATLQAVAAAQPGQSGGFVHGEAIEVPILEAAGQTKVGRFGWKDQDPTVLSFMGDAYLNEMGVTNRLKPHDVTTVGKETADPEDVPDALGLADIDHFAQFVRGLQAPPRDTVLAATPDAVAGQAIFEQIGCAVCHVESFTTAPAGTVINGGTYTIPAAIGNKIIHPFGDYLMHDIGTGDGIFQAGPVDTTFKLRTEPLWGLRMRPRYMHDLASPTLESAIERHLNEAVFASNNFFRLTPEEQQQLFTFLNTL